MLTKNIGILLGLALLSVSHVHAADTRCHREWLCLHTVNSNGFVEYQAENKRPFPLTLSFRFDTRNLKRLDTSPETLTLPGNEARVLARFKIINTGKPVRFKPVYDWVAGKLNAEHDDSVVYRLPYDSARAYSILQGYGGRFSHEGNERYTLDFNMRIGTPIHAARGGVVIDVVEHNDKGGWNPAFSRYANYIVIEHEDGTTGEYYHLSKNGAFLDIGARVEEGQLIGLSGNTGHTAMPHLHFGVYRAAPWGQTISVPVSFKTREGVIDNPRRGRRYYAE
ncbi:MAG: M23 family metallopeptidase [Gammaproteobacteria bacterium]